MKKKTTNFTVDKLETMVFISHIRYIPTLKTSQRIDPIKMQEKCIRVVGAETASSIITFILFSN